MSSSSIQPVVNVLNLDMGTIDANSNLSTRQLVKYLLDRDNNAVRLFNRKEANFLSEVSGYGQIKSEFSALKNAVSKLTDPSLFSSYLTKVTDSLGLYSRSLEAVASDTATEGNYQIKIQQLATNQVKTTGEDTVVATANTSTAQYGQNGTQIEFAFNKYAEGKDSYVESINFTLTLNSAVSLNDLVDQINSATGNTSSQYISASTVDANTANSQKLQLTSNVYGTQGQFTINLSSDSSNGNLTKLFNSLSETQAGQDAIVEINGSTLQSNENSAISNFIQGVVLTLNQADSTKTLNLQVYNDPTKLNTAMNSFVSAFNTLASNFDNIKTENLSKDKLVMDTLNSYMSNFVSKSIDNASYSSIKSLQNLGLSFDSSTKQVVFDNQILSNFLESTSNEVSNFLKDQSKNGFNSQVSNFVDKLAGDQSYVYLRSLGLKDDYRDVTKQRYQTGNSEQIQNRLQDQLFALDNSLGRFQELGTYISLQSSSQTSTASGKINNGLLNLIEQSSNSNFLKNLTDTSLNDKTSNNKNYNLILDASNKVNGLQNNSTLNLLEQTKTNEDQQKVSKETEDKKSSSKDQPSFSLLTAYHNFDGLYTNFLK